MNEDLRVHLPEAFLNKMENLLGDEFEAFVQSYETERVQGLRFNTLKGNLEKMISGCRDLFNLTPVLWCREGFYYQADTKPGKHPFHEAGVYYIQEPSAMAVVSVLNPHPGDHVLDLCAAPGGKTTHIAERLCGEGLLVSNEIHPARAKILAQNVERMGIANAVVTNEDSGKLKRHFRGFFDKIVVDAPCSGEGMFRKDEQAKDQWSEANVKLCAKRQQEILDNAAEMLKPGGKLVYSTCTFSPEEDEDGIAAFLERHPEFAIIEPEQMDGFEQLSTGHQEWSSRNCAGLEKTFRIWPHKTEGEGHYLALLSKSGDVESDLTETWKVSDEKCEKRKKTLSKQKDWIDKTGHLALEECLDGIMTGDAEWYTKMGALVPFGDQIYRIPEGMVSLDGLRVLRAGLHLGTLKKNRFEPAHALALALRPDQVHENVCLDIDSQELKAYLAGNTIPDTAGRKGWVLVCAENYSLGWAKAVSGTLKNHYPKGLRIS